MLIPASSLLYSHNRYWSPDCYGGAVVYHQPNLGGTKATARYFVCDVFDAQVNNKMLLLMIQQYRVLFLSRHTVSLDAARHLCLSDEAEASLPHCCPSGTLACLPDVASASTGHLCSNSAIRG